MLKSRFIPLGAVALLALAHGSLGAQSTKQTVELAFGYECGDRFLVRNDGTQPVVIEYAIAGSQDKSQLHLNARQSVEIATAQSGNMELYVSGKVVASEAKGNLACKGGAPNNDGVAVRSLDANNSDAAMAEAVEPGYNAAPVVVYARPDYYYPYSYYPYSYGWGYPSLSFYSRGGFGGFGGRVGPIGRGRPTGGRPTGGRPTGGRGRGRR